MKGSCLLELVGFNFPPAAIRELFNAADLHHDGVIEYDEFVSSCLWQLKSQTGMNAKSAPVRKADCQCPRRAGENNLPYRCHFLISLL